MSAAKNNKKRNVNVHQPKPWGLIITFSVVGVAALAIVLGSVYVIRDAKQAPEGTVSFYGEFENGTALRIALEKDEVDIEDLEHPIVGQRTHVEDGTYVDYGSTPPVGGNHYGRWQQCTGVVYNGIISNGHAVHSLEHGAVWVTYDPDLLDDRAVATLAVKVDGRDYTMMSQYPGQGSPISLQAWGFQLQLEDPNDERINKFISRFARAADNAMEPGATCSNGVTSIVTSPNPEPPADDEEHATEDEHDHEGHEDEENGDE